MLPSASSAGSALSAAIAGVSPFATRRSRAQPTTATTTATTTAVGSPPSSGLRGGGGGNSTASGSGSDSCFGVRSLDGSVSWSVVGRDGGTADLHTTEGDADAEEAQDASPSSNSGSASEQTSDDDDHDNERDPHAAFENERDRLANKNRHVKNNNKSSTPTADIAEAIESRITASASTSTAHAESRQSSGSSSATTVASRSHAASHARTPSDDDNDATPHPPHLAPPGMSEAHASPHHHHHHRRSVTPSSSPAIPQSPSPARLSRGQDLSPIMPPPPIMQHTLLDMLADAPSEPSSPASLASLPSCVASMSSLSRMSSPADWDWRHPLSRSVATVDSRESRSDNGRRGHRSGSEADPDADADPHSGSAELVLPTLALPNTSLHLGLERWNTPGQGTRIALVASPERTRDVLGVLAARRPCVQLPRGEVGVLSSTTTSASAGDIASHPPVILATILTCLSAEHIRQRANDAYTSLHALLNPSPSREHQAGLESMVAAYASSKDWVHLAVLLDDAAEDGTDIDIVPCTTLEEEAALITASSEGDGGVHSEGDMPSSTSTSLSPTSSFSPGSSLNLPDRTPRSTSGESLSDLRVQHTPRPPLDSLEPEPWPAHAHESSSPLVANSMLDSHNDLALADPCDPVFGTVALLERIIDDPVRVHAMSTASFFEWRPTPLPDISSPITGPSTSPASSTFEGAGPMPTVARAQGGGEWEATLSRRLAHRRELDASASTQRGTRPRGRGRGTRRRRSHSPPDKLPCPTPLFPRRPIASSVGLVDLIDAAFAPVRRFVRSPWGQVVVACAIAVAVGCGIWAVRAQA